MKWKQQRQWAREKRDSKSACVCTCVWKLSMWEDKSHRGCESAKRQRSCLPAERRRSGHLLCEFVRVCRLYTCWPSVLLCVSVLNSSPIQYKWINQCIVCCEYYKTGNVTKKRKIRDLVFTKKPLQIVYFFQKVYSGVSGALSVAHLHFHLQRFCELCSSGENFVFCQLLGIDAAENTTISEWLEKQNTGENLLKTTLSPDRTSQILQNLGLC